MKPKTRNPNSTSRMVIPIICGIGILVLLDMVLASCGGGGPRQLISVSVQPVSGQAIAPDGTVPFSATGTFDQAPTTQANLPVQWTSSDSTVATIDPNTGIATCLVVGGPVTVTGSAAGKGGTVNGTATLACKLSPDPVVKLDPASLGFECKGTVAGCQCTAPETTTLTNVGGATLAIDSLSIGSPFSRLLLPDTCSASVDAGQSCTIGVGFHPPSLGTFRGSVDISDNAADSPQVVSLSGQAFCIP
jgi:hypothetical protein